MKADGRAGENYNDDDDENDEDDVNDQGMRRRRRLPNRGRGNAKRDAGKTRNAPVKHIITTPIRKEREKRRRRALRDAAMRQSLLSATL